MNAFTDLFARASGLTGVSESYFSRLAQIESGSDPSAQNSRSSAGGLFQFIDKTWAQYGTGSRFDPAAATNAVASFTGDNYKSLQRALGRDPTHGELYLAHQQGAGGAIKLLSNPNALAADVVGLDAVRLNAGNASMTAGEFAGLWTDKFEGSSPGAYGGSTGGIGGGVMSAVADYFARGVVIILGFIFVAVGLAMFKNPLAISFVQGVREGANEAIREVPK